MLTRRRFLGVCGLGVALGLTACSTPASQAADASAADDAPADEASPVLDEPSSEPVLSEAEQKLASMTLEEKAAQLFMITLETLEDPAGTAAEASIEDDPNAAEGQAPVTEVTVDLEQNLQKYPVGGVILFANNIVTPEQTLALTNGLKEAAEKTTDRVPLFIAVDEEGGLVARLANNEGFGLPTYESAGAVGASGNPEDAREMGETIGSYLEQYGFTVDFAPDADVNTNPENPVIGTRAFSDDPEKAAELSKAFAEGLAEHNVIATYKHFPGHGDTQEDSHTTLATTNKTLDELSACELVPFQGATSGDFVMVGHIAAPEVTGNDTPATLSPELIGDVLRGQLNFEGVVVTDALGMGAITERYGAADVAVQALKAGCDLLLMPADFEMAYDAVLSAVRNGELTEERLNESVLRILDVKYKTEETNANAANQ